MHTGFSASKKLTTRGGGGARAQTNKADVLRIQSEQCRRRRTAKDALRAVSFTKIQMTFFTGLLGIENSAPSWSFQPRSCTWIIILSTA